MQAGPIFAPGVGNRIESRQEDVLPNALAPRAPNAFPPRAPSPLAPHVAAPQVSSGARPAGDVPLPPPQSGVIASNLAIPTGRSVPAAHGVGILHRPEGASYERNAARIGASIVLPTGASSGAPTGAPGASPAGNPVAAWTANPNVSPNAYRAPGGAAPTLGASLPSAGQGATTASPESRIDVAGQIDPLAAAPRRAGSVPPSSAGIIVPSAEPGRTQPAPTALVSEAAAHTVPEARSAPVEAAQARAAPAAPMAADPHMNLRMQIANVRLSEGRTRVELTPRGLGDIEIDLRQEGGQLRVVLRAENPAVLAGLRQDREGIAAMLRDGGVDLGDGALGFESFDGHRPRGQPSTDGQVPAYGPAAPPREVTEDAAAEAESPVVSVPGAAGSASRLDLMT